MPLNQCSMRRSLQRAPLHTVKSVVCAAAPYIRTTGPANIGASTHWTGTLLFRAVIGERFDVTVPTALEFDLQRVAGARGTDGPITLAA